MRCMYLNYFFKKALFFYVDWTVWISAVAVQGFDICCDLLKLFVNVNIALCKWLKLEKPKWKLR